MTNCIKTKYTVIGISLLILMFVFFMGFELGKRVRKVSWQDYFGEITVSQKTKLGATS